MADPSNLKKDPKIEEQITAAFETLSDEDKELFEDTRLIHTDRDVSVDTQVYHVVNLHKKSQRRRKMVVMIILILLIIGIIGSALGIYLYHQNQAAEEAAVTPEVSEEPEVEIAIDAANFPDDAFRERVILAADANGDNMLSSDEISSLIMINLAGDERIHDLTGISYLTDLQSLDISHTAVASLDLSANTALTNLNISGDNIAVMDLSHQTALTTLNISDCNALTNVILPEPSAITSITSDHTSFDCARNNEGIYTSCQLIIE